MTALLTASEFSAGTGGKVSASDPRVQPLLDGATAAVRRFCGWHIGGVETETRLFDTAGGVELSIPTMRLTAISSVVADGVTVDVSTLEWSQLGQVRNPAGWPNKYRGVQITFTHGFTIAEVADVRQVIQQIVANACASPMGATREQAGQLSASWSMTAPNVSGGVSLLERDLAILRQYKV